MFITDDTAGNITSIVDNNGEFVNFHFFFLNFLFENLNFWCCFGPHCRLSNPIFD